MLDDWQKSKQAAREEVEELETKLNECSWANKWIFRDGEDIRAELRAAKAVLRVITERLCPDDIEAGIPNCDGPFERKYESEDGRRFVEKICGAEACRVNVSGHPEDWDLLLTGYDTTAED